MAKQQRAELSTAELNDLPDSAFAYIEPGGSKDDDGKTTPRSLRHYAIHDKAHADNALARANAQISEGDDDAKGIAEKALPKIKTAVEKFAETEEKKAAAWDAQHRDEGPSYEDMRDMLSSAAAAQYDDDDDDCYVYVYDFGDDWLVYSKGGEKYRCSYTLEGDKVTLGAPEPVRAVTTYQPIQTNSAPRNPATPKRAFSSLIEQPPAHTVPVEIRMATGESTSASFTGYASVTEVAYGVRDWLGEYTETMRAGCFAKTLREQSDVPLLFNHDGVPLASTASGTSKLQEDGKGLRNDADFDLRDALTNSICVQLDRGVLNKMSFSFRTIKDAWNDEYDARDVTEAALYDTSIVTYPANPATTAELTEAMRSALGREGRSLWLADNELSVRSALPSLVQRQDVPDDADDLLERALRALAHADEVVCRSKGSHGRARTFLVAHTMVELRAGKTLSSKNEGLLKQALDALGAADKQHQKLANSHAEAAEKVANVLATANAGTSDDGQSNQSSPGGNTIAPQDGAGPRAQPNPHLLAREREQEITQLRRARR